MQKVFLSTAGVAVTVGLMLAGCGKPENSAYTQKPQDAAQLAALSSPLPPAPAWASSVLGQPISAFAKGSSTCKSAVDLTLKHAPKGGVAGYEIQGWAWDIQDKTPPARLLLTDATAHIVGAGEMTRARPDVPHAVPEVKSAQVGWTLVTRATHGPATIVGLTPSGSLCTIAPAHLS